MAVKASGSGVIEEKVIRTRQIPDNSSPEAAGGTVEDGKFDPWEFIAALTPGDWNSRDYSITIERGPKHLRAEERTWVGKYYEAMLPDTIQERFGGGTYTIWLKVPPKAQQLRWKGELKVEGAPKSGGTNGNGASAAPAGNDPLSQVLQFMREQNQMMMNKLDQLAGGPGVTKAVDQAVALSAQVFGAAVPAIQAMVTKISGGTAGSADPIDVELEREMRRAMIRRMTGEGGQEKSAIETTVSTITALRDAKLLGSGESRGPVGMTAEIVREIPSIVSGIRDSLAYYARGAEAQARIVSMQGTAAAGGRPPAPVALPPAPEAQPPATPAAPAGELVEPGQMLDMQIASILTNPALSIEEAATQVAVVLEAAERGLSDQLAAMGEAGLLQLFDLHPILRDRVPKDPRLPEFIKKFIEVVKGAPVYVPPTPGSPTPPPA